MLLLHATVQSLVVAMVILVILTVSAIVWLCKLRRRRAVAPARHGPSPCAALSPQCLTVSTVPPPQCLGSVSPPQSNNAVPPPQSSNPVPPPQYDDVMPPPPSYHDAITAAARQTNDEHIKY
ncbi:hypothetical protein B566_EDAN001459 [Ephemera danica]|nr:hypothetical protein B566_EDAN001459 [Ephemera danica]